jgi:hypothetical protein
MREVMVRARDRNPSRGGLVAILAIGAILWCAPGAAAQSVADQYVPKLDRAGASDPAGGPGGSATDGGQAPDGQTAGGASLTASETVDGGDAGGGSLPGGGFPLTGFVTLLVVVVILALLTRLLLPLTSWGSRVLGR